VGKALAAREGPFLPCTSRNRRDGLSGNEAYLRHATRVGFLVTCVGPLLFRLVLTGRRQKEVVLSDAGLRGWDGEGLRLREYGEMETGRMLWNYLPISPALCQVSKRCGRGASNMAVSTGDCNYVVPSRRSHTLGEGTRASTQRISHAVR
jgi:hypothetical protein